MQVTENSEEVRLLEINFLRLIVSKYGLHLPAYLSDIIDILCKSIIDPYPEVKIASCACASELSMVIPAHFHMQSESLISPLTQTLGHRQSKVRISAINAIGKFSLIFLYSMVKFPVQTLTKFSSFFFQPSPCALGSF